MRGEQLEVDVLKLARDEQETHLSLVADNRGQWVAFSEDPVLQKKLDRIADGKPHGDAGGRVYILDKTQVSLRKKQPQRILTDDERRAIGKRLRSGRERQA